MNMTSLEARDPNLPSTILVCTKNLGTNLKALETMQPAVKNPKF
jgi:hypothetical protein